MKIRGSKNKNDIENNVYYVDEFETFPSAYIKIDRPSEIKRGEYEFTLRYREICTGLEEGKRPSLRRTYIIDYGTNSQKIIEVVNKDLMLIGKDFKFVSGPYKGMVPTADVDDESLDDDYYGDE